MTKKTGNNNWVLIENNILLETHIEISIDEFFEKYYNAYSFKFKDEFDSKDLQVTSSAYYKIVQTREIVYLIYYNKENDKLILKFLCDNSELENNITPEVIGVIRIYYFELNDGFKPGRIKILIRKNEYFNQKMLFDFFKNKLLNRLNESYNIINLSEYNECPDKTEYIEKIKFLEKDIIESIDRFTTYKNKSQT